MKQILLLVIALTMLSCTDTTPEQIKKLKTGMSEKKAVKLLGEPYQIRYRTKGPEYYYRYRSPFYRTTLYLYFENDTIESWY